jgi:hypothetical protein
MSYELSVTHRKEAPSHSNYILSSKHFRDDEKLIKLCKKNKKIFKIKESGDMAIEDPFKIRKRLRGFTGKLGARSTFFEPSNYVSDQDLTSENIDFDHGKSNYFQSFQES